ncbi:MAG: UTP--glucose-1-phosphate uridylyltransferase, partial [Spirochaetia bacterium]|jgi:UDP-N-acetylglucosamine pyrophosphorylase|nr:UTP--glucose-1-phosphate uridylyltransferase [Spirochaetia bacterium]
MRSILLKIKKYRDNIGNADFSHPLFQMTSCRNNILIEKGFKEYSQSILLEKLIGETGADITSPLTGIQPMIPAFTHSSEGKIRDVFTNAWGKTGEMIPLPGGHGQNFQVLKDVYMKLYDEGKRFVYLGNVDNIGFNIDFAEVAVLALSGKQAAFDFSFKTSVDVKGGILVYDEKEKINCVDIGPAISVKEVEAREKEGKPILFNCATGLFNLEYLINNIDRIIDNLPLRISDQEKDAGRYSQAEQTTWEVIGILDDFLIFGVDKYKRFLASKLFMENLLISRPDKIVKYFDKNPDDAMNIVSHNMNRGLENILTSEMDMKNLNGIWQ